MFGEIFGRAYLAYTILEFKGLHNDAYIICSYKIHTMEVIQGNKGSGEHKQILILLCANIAQVLS